LGILGEGGSDGEEDRRKWRPLTGDKRLEARTTTPSTSPFPLLILFNQATIILYFEFKERCRITL
jgi:hypothetical protein